MRRVRRWSVGAALCAAIVMMASAGTGNAATQSHTLSAGRFHAVAQVGPQALLGAQAGTRSQAAPVPHAATAAIKVMLPLSTLDDVVIDPTAQRVFVTGTGTVSGHDLVVYSMTTNTVVAAPGLASESGASGMVLDGSTLYVDRCAAGEIDAINPSTLAITATISIPAQSGTCSLALAGGRLWFSDNASAGLAAVGLTAPYTVSTYTESGGALPDLASAPSSPHPDLLVAWPGSNPDPVSEFDTSQDPPVLGTTGTLQGITQAVVTPNGSDLLVADYGGAFAMWSLADLSTPIKTYTLPFNEPLAAAVTGGGTFVATVTNEYARPTTEADVSVFPAGSATPTQTWRLSEAADSLSAARAVYSGNAQALYVATQTGSGGVAMHVLSYPDRLPDTLTVATSRGSIRYGGTITITAHLGSFGSDRTITIWRHNAGGGRYYRLKTGNVGPLHNLAVVDKPTYNQDYYATFGGDSSYQPVTSAVKLVYVHEVIHGSLSGYYGTSGGYHLYHPGVHPLYSITTAPIAVDNCVTVVLERHFASGWEAVSKCFQADQYGRLKVQLLDLTAGAEYRVGAAYESTYNAVGGTPWSYFRVT